MLEQTKQILNRELFEAEIDNLAILNDLEVRGGYKTAIYEELKGQLDNQAFQKIVNKLKEQTRSCMPAFSVFLTTSKQIAKEQQELLEQQEHKVRWERYQAELNQKKQEKIQRNLRYEQDLTDICTKSNVTRDVATQIYKKYMQRLCELTFLILKRDPEAQSFYEKELKAKELTDEAKMCKTMDFFDKREERERESNNQRREIA
jgi:hypothetical protein